MQILQEKSERHRESLYEEVEEVGIDRWCNIIAERNESGSLTVHNTLRLIVRLT